MTRRRPALVELTLCRTKEFLRESEAVFWVFAFPVLLAVALGFAFREKAPDRIPVGVLTEGAAAQVTLATLSAAPALRARGYAGPDGHEALRTGKISLLVEPGPPVVFHFDAGRPDSRIARLEANEALQLAAGRRDPLAVASQQVTEKGARYIDFLIPGLLGMNLMGTGIWGIAFSVTVARNRRILKRLIATPMRKSHFLFAQILGRLVFLLPEIVLLVGFGWVAFGVAVHGSVLLLLAVSLLGAMTFCGFGLLCASRVSTIEGASGIANLIMLPMWILSGTFFSSARFPDAVQPVIQALPLTALNQALRAIVNEGAGLAAVLPQLGIVAAWGLVTFFVALKLFRWK